MASPLDRKFDLIEGGTDNFLSSLSKADEQLALELLKIYADFLSGRVLILDAERLAGLEDAIIAAVKKTGYKDAVDSYIPNFDELKKLNDLMHQDINKIATGTLLEEHNKINNHISMVQSQLRGLASTTVKYLDDGTGQLVTLDIPNKSLNELIDPIAELIRSDVILGVDFKSATESILQAIQDKEVGLERWAGQIARDALSQSDGIQQQAIKEEFGLKYNRYVGTIIGTTRPFCYHMLTQKDRAVWTDDEVQDVLDEYCPGGVPSKTEMTYTPLGKSHRRQKGSGMIPGTTLDTFSIYRGGFSCRHQVVPTKIK